jgi:hypothetical protein
MNMTDEGSAMIIVYMEKVPAISKSNLRRLLSNYYSDYIVLLISHYYSKV